MFNMRELVLWVKIFIISFIVVALVRYVFEVMLDVEHEWGSIALTAGLVAVAFATAHWVMRPRPKPKGMHDVLVSMPPASRLPPAAPAYANLQRHTPFGMRHAAASRKPSTRRKASKPKSKSKARRRR